MPMPRLPPTQYRNIASQNAFQLKKNNAATAPTCNESMKPAVSQLIPFSLADSLPKSLSVMWPYWIGF